MVILHKEKDTTGSFYIHENGKDLGEIVYKKDRGRMIIEHTQVDESLRGKNLGFNLVEKAVEYARAENLRIIPVCSFAKKIINRHKQFRDVLDVL